MLNVSFQIASAQSLSVPEGRRLRDIVVDNYPEGKLLIGATTGSWGLNETIGRIMNREFSYVTPENDFKQSIVRANPEQWEWSRADAWLQHIIDHEQVLRIHGPISPQCSKWAKEDNRTAEELAIEMDTFMTALCNRYNGIDGIKYLDVVNEIALSDGRWHMPRAGTDLWENPWFLIGQDNDPAQTPLYVSRAFAIANEHAPDMKLILNNHCHPGTAGMEKVKSTILYLRDRGYRVDGLGWQAHVDVGWATAENLQALRDDIDWCQSRDLEFHITEFDAWITNPYTQTLEGQAYTFKAIMDVLIEKLDSLTIGWNTWHITDAAGWKTERIPSLFDINYEPKPAYYAFQLALEARGDYETPYKITFQFGSTDSGKPIEGCSVFFNGEELMSNANGEVNVSPASAGRYTLEASKKHLLPISNRSISIYSDTLIALWMDSSRYEVTYHLIDDRNGSNISGVEVQIDTSVLITDMGGLATFSITPGIYNSTFQKTEFKPLLLEHNIDSDTFITIGLQETHSDIKFRIKNVNAPVNEALVVLEGDSLYTNALGICTFESIPVDISYGFVVSKNNYFSFTGELVVRQDSTVDIQLLKTVANVEFLLDDESLNALNAMVVINHDSVWLNEEGRCKYYNVPISFEYQYEVFSDNYSVYRGSLFVENDTLIVLYLNNTLVSNIDQSESLRIYPNPAMDLISIQSNLEFDLVEIYGISGIEIAHHTGTRTSTHMDVSNLREGFYWIRVCFQKNGVKTTVPLIILD